MSILRLENVVKTYNNDYKAVNNISLEMPEGSIFGMLGPNGAGKTSLIRIITTITKADSGKIWLANEPLSSKNVGWVGYMPEERGLYKKMKVGEQLLYLAQLKGLSNNDAKKALEYWLSKFSINDWWNKKVEDLSKGMQQKVQFIATVVHRPKLLILDEPFTGLDPINANLLQDEIYQLREQGTSIIFSTHRMEQVEEICDDIVLINKGEVILSGKVKDIKQTYKAHQYCIEFDEPLPEDLEMRLSIVHKKLNSVIIHLEDGQTSNDILQHFLKNNVNIRSFHEILPTLNEIFIKKVEQHNL